MHCRVRKTGLQAISAISAGNMKEIVLPPCAEVIVCGDNDESGVGRRAAEAAAGRWTTAGREVCIAIPGKYKDWNEALRDQEADHEALCTAILTAPAYGRAKITSLGM